MDTINIEKILARKKYHQKNHFVNNLYYCSCIAMSCSLLCFFSSSHWFPSLCSSMNAFLFVSLPNLKALALSPKCLFIVCNIIVVFLIGESKLVGKSKSSPDSELYEEYIKRSRNQQTSTTTQVVKKETEVKKLEVCLIDEVSTGVVNTNRVTQVEVQKGHEKQEEQEQKQEQEEVVSFDDYEEEEEEEEEVEAKGLAQEELNKRVEEFIARMNKQRRLEAGSIVCCY